MFDAELFSNIAAFGSDEANFQLGDTQLQDWLKPLAQKYSSALASLGIDTSTDGNDIRIGGPGNDTMYALGGNDWLFGQSGNDILGGNNGQDVLSGGKGEDWLNGGADNDMLLGGCGQDTLVGGSGDDVLLGGNGNDTLKGQSGNDQIFGGSGDDELEGGTGQDTLEGGSGNDILSDVDGGDRLTGGRGNDKFQLGSGQSLISPSVITDFRIGSDTISFTDLGITFEDLAFTDKNGNAEIRINDQVIAVLEGIRAADLNPDSFRFVTNSHFDTDLQEALEQALSDSVSPGATAAVLTADGHLWTGAKGISDIENNIPTSASDRFNAGSAAKTFTATVIMQLVEEGKLSLEATLDQYLPDSVTSKIPNSDQITLRQLLSHTSGINNAVMSEYDQDMLNNPSLAFEQWTPGDMLSRYTYNREPSFPPNTKIDYNNANYFLLGFVVESVTNSTLAHEVQERIIEPLGLENTFLAGEEERGQYQPSYMDLDNNGKLDLNTGAVDLARSIGAGGLISNAEDLARFTQALFNGELVNPETVNEMITGGKSIDPNIPEVGLGFGFAYREIAGRGKELIVNGDDYGWSTRIRYDQSTGTVAVAITNGAKIDPSQNRTTKAVEEILKTVLQN